MNDAQYRTLFQCVKGGKCVLVVGPDLYRVEGRPLNRAMTEFLASRNPDEIDFYDFKDELFYFKGEDKRVSKNAVYYNLQEFYEGTPPGELHEQIARIPFPLIVNCAPDLMLANAFEKQRIAHEFRFYNKSLNPDSANTSFAEEESFDAVPEYPLVYNLLGHIGYEESLILSYPDLFDFLYNVFGRNNLPQSLRHILDIQDDQDRKNYLFLGFQFNKWYLQMILRLLNAQAGMQRFVFSEGIGALDNAMPANDNTDRGFFYIKNYFTLKIFDEAPVTILQQLYADCEKEGLLRPTDTLDRQKNGALSADKPLSLQLEEMVANNKITQALQEMTRFFKENGQTQLASDTVMQSSMYNDLLQLERKGSLYVSERWVQKSKITNALMDFIEEIRKLENTTAA